MRQQTVMTLLFLFVLMFACSGFAEDSKQQAAATKDKPKPPAPKVVKISYPDEARNTCPPGTPAEKCAPLPPSQVFVEVNAQSYPGLNLTLSELPGRLTFSRRYLAEPNYNAQYWENGGILLQHWQIPMRYSQLVTVKQGVP